MSVKIQTSFVPRRRRLIPALSLGLCVAALGVFGFCVGMIAAKTDMANQRLQMEQRVISLSQKREALTGLQIQIPSAQDVQELNRRIAVVSGPGYAQGHSAAKMLVHLEQLLPAQAYLVSLRYKGKRGEVAFVAESDDKSTLTEFLKGIEKDRYFREVLLTRQAQAGANGQHQFEFRLLIKGS